MLSQGFAGPDGALDPAGLELPVGDPPRPGLVPFSFWWAGAAGAAPPPYPQAPGASAQPDRPIPPDPADLRDAIRSHLDDLGWPAAEALRWAITAVDPLRGLQLEGVGVIQAQVAVACR